MWMLLGLFLVLFLLVLLLITFSVEFELHLLNNDVKIRVRFGIGHFFIIALPNRLLKTMGQRIQTRNLNTLDDALQGLNTALRVLGSFLQKIELLQLEVLFSLGDALWTSLGCGGLWATLGPFLAALDASDRLQNAPQIVIQPDYGEAKVKAHIHCIFHFRLGQIIRNEIKRATYVAKGAEQ